MPNNSHNGESLGDYGGGVSARRVSLEHTRMIERAIREKWPVPDEYREPLVMRQIRVALDAESSARESTSAFKSILAAESQNMEAEHRALEMAGVLKGDHSTVNQQINIYGHVREAAAELLKSDGYSDFIRSRAAQRDIDAGAVCQIRESGNGHAVENGTAHGGPRPGTNGHRNGKE